MEEGIDGFVVSGAEYFVEGAEKAVFDPASAEVVYAMRGAFTKVSKETGKDRALIVSLGSGGGNATQRSVFYGSTDHQGADLVLDDRLANALGKSRARVFKSIQFHEGESFSVRKDSRSLVASRTSFLKIVFFLVADTKLYKRLYPLVRPSVWGHRVEMW